MTIFEQNNFQLSSDEKTREIDARVQRLKLEDWDRPAGLNANHLSDDKQDYSHGEHSQNRILSKR